MAITLNVAATPAFEAGGATQDRLESASVTIAANTDRVLMVGVLSGAGTPVDPSAVRWGGSGGTALTQVGATVDCGANVKLSLWRLIAPNATTSTIHVTWGSSQDERAIVAACYDGVDQTTPLRASSSATGHSTTPSINATSVSGDWVVDAIGFLDTGGGAQTIAVGANQTSHGEVEGANLTYEALGHSHEVATGVSTTMSWTTSGGAVDWGIIAAALIPSTGGGGGSTLRKNSLMRLGVGR
jgi:hypothetical protein